MRAVYKVTCTEPIYDGTTFKVQGDPTALHAAALSMLALAVKLDPRLAGATIAEVEREPSPRRWLLTGSAVVVRP